MMMFAKTIKEKRKVRVPLFEAFGNLIEMIFKVLLRLDDQDEAECFFFNANRNTLMYVGANLL